MADHLETRGKLERWLVENTLIVVYPRLVHPDLGGTFQFSKDFRHLLDQDSNNNVLLFAKR